MKTSSVSNSGTRGGFTLIEMTLVIFLLIALISMGVMSSGGIKDWQAGKTASETLRSVYTAQRTYLADNPTAPLSSLTNAKLLNYLPTRETVFPTIKDLTGTTRSIIVTVSPPVVNNGAGVAYDPSGNPKDSLWDVGE